MEWLYFVVLIAFVAIMFTIVRRPMYEVIFLAFIFLVIISGNLSNIGTYLYNTASNYMLFSISAFIAFGMIFEKTGIISDMINIIVSIVGRFSGGAGYVALVGSAAMGALSGTGPGNAAAIGVITIPAMKRSGFSAEMAATIEMAASSLGPIIPPAGAIVLCHSILVTMYPEYTFSQFWLLAWAVSFWLLLQRFITLYILIKRQHVAPIPKEQRPTFKQAMKEGWRSLLLPVIIFIPFMFDALFNDTLVAARLGEEAAGVFSNILLTVIPSVASLVVVLLYVQKGNRFSFKELANAFYGGEGSVAPVLVMAFAGFAITELFTDMGVAESLSASLAGISIPRWFVAIVIPLIFTFLGMFMEPMSIVSMFCGAFIPIAVSVGIHPMLAAMMVNVMCLAMGHMTPPFALCLFVCMGIAESDYQKTVKLTIVWCVGQYILTVAILMGWIPMFGLLS